MDDELREEILKLITNKIAESRIEEIREEETQRTIEKETETTKFDWSTLDDINVYQIYTK